MNYANKQGIKLNQHHEKRKSLQKAQSYFN